MRTLYLLCEGVKKSPDSQILNIVIDGIAGVELIPMGGKFGSGAYLQGFLGSLSNSNTLYLTFRDRDFDAPVPQNECLSQSPLQAKVYMSYRSTIENYLLLPENILVFCEKNNILVDNGNEINNIQVLFRKAAQDLKYYQAARWALGDMRDVVRFNTSWLDGSGSLPTDLTDNACVLASKQLLEQIREKPNSWTDDKFDEKYAHYLAIFDTDFFQNDQYLIWFQAKDLQTQLTKYLPTVTGNPFPFKTFYKAALKAF